MIVFNNVLFYEFQVGAKLFTVIYRTSHIATNIFHGQFIFFTSLASNCKVGINCRRDSWQYMPQFSESGSSKQNYLLFL